MVTSVNCFSMCSRSGWAKIVRMIEGTMSWEPFGTTERALRMKWTRHRCQDAPWNTVPIAFFKPSVSVAHDQLHPVEAAHFQRAEERGPEPFVFGISHVEAEDLPATFGGDSDGGDSDGDNDGLGDDAVVHARFAVGCVEEYVWVVQGRQRSVPELTPLRRPGQRRSARPPTSRSRYRRRAL